MNLTSILKYLIYVCTRTIKKIHELDEMAIMMVEEIIHTSYTSDGKMRKKRYYRERQLSKKQLDNIMKLLKNF